MRGHIKVDGRTIERLKLLVDQRLTDSTKEKIQKMSVLIIYHNINIIDVTLCNCRLYTIELRIINVVGFANIFQSIDKW